MSTPTDALMALSSRRFSAVLFDLDGTLIDSTAAVLRSWSRWASEQGLERRPDIPHGVPARQVLEPLVPADQLDAAFRRIEQIEAGEVDGITVLPGALEALEALTGHCAIVTSGTPPLVAARLGVTGLPAPRVVVTAQDVHRGKPFPEPYLLAAERMGVDPRSCLVVEDAPAGLTAAREAGCASLALTTTHGAHELSADAVVATLAEVRFTVSPDGGAVHMIVP